MNYIGSKIRLSSWIKSVVIDVIGELSGKTFADIFAGTGAVGQSFKGDVKSVISNDLEYYSYILNRNYIENSREIEKANEYIDLLNSLALISDGFIFHQYSEGGDGERIYFSSANGKRIDTMRQEIERLKTSKEIDDNLYYFLLASLLESADRVANTASVYGAFLKKLKKTAQKEMILKPAYFEIDDKSHRVYNMDSNQLIKEISGDILYLDPPYNQRQYGANYHLLNTIAEYKQFAPKGKTGLPNYNRSNYSKKGEVLKSFDELIKSAKFQYIFLSYNNEGLMSQSEIQTVMSKYGKYSLEKREYQRFKADSSRNHKANLTFEYLHILEKDYSLSRV